MAKPPLPLVGLIEIAMRAGVRRPVVSGWRSRYPDFPAPVAELAVGPVFWWPDVEEWLRATGRQTDADWSRDQIAVPWKSQTSIVRIEQGDKTYELPKRGGQRARKAKR